MKVIFISNYINHHQKPFCDAMYKRLGDDFIFIQSEPMEEERINMGWDTTLTSLPYVKLLYENEDECRELILSADALIAGWTKRVDLLKERLDLKRLTIRVYERIYREGQWKAVSPRGILAKYNEHIKYRNYPAYLLCCGAYVASDFSLIKAYPDKMYKFGYFPETKHYDIDELMLKKNEGGKLEIIFAGRFLKLKHPEYMLYLARDLKKMLAEHDEGENTKLNDFRIHMVGSGELSDELKLLAKEYEVEDKINFYGFLKPDEVRSLMEKSHIHVFPSNALEGWGAVVNEAMNSACVVVASAEAGAVPFLIKQNENGIAYKGEDYDSLKQAVISLMQNDDKRNNMAKAAYETIVKLWNADNAADSLIDMINGWMDGKDNAKDDGPLSKALVIPPKKMFSYMESR